MIITINSSKYNPIDVQDDNYLYNHTQEHKDTPIEDKKIATDDKEMATNDSKIGKQQHETQNPTRAKDESRQNNNK